MTDDIRVIIGGDAAGLNKSLAEAQRIVADARAGVAKQLALMDAKVGESQKLISGGLGKAFGAFGEAVRPIVPLLGAFGIGLGAVELVGFARDALNAAGDLGEMAEQLGISAGALQGLQFAAVQNHLSADEMNSSISRLTRTIGLAREGSDQAVQAMRGFGPAVEHLVASGAPTEQILSAIADALQQIDDPAKRAALVVDAFGRGGQKLLPILSQGAAGIKAYADQLKAAGLSLSDEQIHDADRAADALSRLGFEAKQLAGILVTDLVPYLSQAIAGIRQFFAPDLGDQITKSTMALYAAEAKLAEVQAKIKAGGAGEVYTAVMLPRVQAEVDRLRNETETLIALAKTAQADAAGPAGKKPDGAGGNTLVGDAERKRAEEARKMLLDLEAERDGVGKTKAELLQLKLTREMDTSSMVKGGEAVRKYTDAQVAAIVAVQNDIDARERRIRTLRQQLETEDELAQAAKELQIYRDRTADAIGASERATTALRDQADAAGKSTTRWNALTGAYELNDRELQILVETQRLMNLNLGIGATEAEQLAAAHVDAAEALRKAQQSAGRDLQLMQDTAQEAANFMDQAFSRVGNAITEMFAQGKGAAFDWRNVVLGLVSEIYQEFFKLAVLNPIKNELFKSNAPTLDSVGGLIGRLFSGSTGTAIPAGGYTGDFAGQYAGGTPNARAGLSLVGEHGPELLLMRGGEQVIPNHLLPDLIRAPGNDNLGRLGGGAAAAGPTINIYPDLRGASVETVQALHKMMIDLNAHLEPRAVAATIEASRRGRLGTR